MQHRHEDSHAVYVRGNKVANNAKHRHGHGHAVYVVTQVIGKLDINFVMVSKLKM